MCPALISSETVNFGINCNAYYTTYIQANRAHIGLLLKYPAL